MLILIAVLALAMPVSAEECMPTTSQPEIDVVVPFFGRQYFDNDLCQLDEEDEGGDGGGYGGGGPCLFSMWFYTESNDIDGLQRIDEVVDDTCDGMISGDTLTFY